VKAIAPGANLASLIELFSAVWMNFGAKAPVQFGILCDGEVNLCVKPVFGRQGEIKH
jgi:hypothetical protein